MSIEKTWSEFKELIDQSSKEKEEWVYRGHASENWKLVSTLQRFIGQDVMLMKEYHAALLHVLSDEKIKSCKEVKGLIFPKSNPCIVGLMTGVKNHEDDMREVFKFMIHCRHYGFPSPLLDWTKNPFIAVFFAASKIEVDEDLAIYRIKEKESVKIGDRIDLSGLHIHKSEFEFSEQKSRHVFQESVYTLAISQLPLDHMRKIEDRQGPSCHLDAYEDMDQKNIEIEKYVITDSGNRKKRIEILKELYDQKVTFEKIYGDTNFLENTVLKDMAIRSLLFKA